VPQDHARDARFKPPLDRSPITNAAAELNGQGSALQNLTDRRRIPRATFDRTVQIDNVQPRKPKRLKRRRLGRRIVVEDGRALHFPAQQPHALAAFEVDRGIKDHGRHRTKFCNSCKPTA
jgi:hypothetical protein